MCPKEKANKMLDPHTLLEGKIAVNLSRVEQQKDPFASKELLAIAADFIQQKEPMPYDLANWISDALIDLSKGKKPEEALCLKPLRKSKFTEEMEMMIAESIVYHPGGRHKGINKDGSPGAYLAASEKYSISENTAEKIFLKHGPDIIESHRIYDELKREEGLY
jgi:hypothetical protein